MSNIDIATRSNTVWYDGRINHTTWGDGSFVWRLDSKPHREDGPAVYFKNGYLKWYRHGLVHREDGPACIYESGAIVWCFEGNAMTFSEWCKKVRPSDELMTKLLLEYPLNTTYE